MCTERGSDSAPGVPLYIHLLEDLLPFYHMEGRPPQMAHLLTLASLR